MEPECGNERKDQETGSRKENEKRKADTEILNQKREKWDLMTENECLSEDKERISKELTKAKTNNMHQNVTRVINNANK